MTFPKAPIIPTDPPGAPNTKQFPGGFQLIEEQLEGQVPDLAAGVATKQGGVGTAGRGAAPGVIGASGHKPGLNPVADPLNWEQLTTTERWLYTTGIPKLQGSNAMDFMTWMGESWPGRLLAKLDVLAEGLERTTGLVAQWNAARRDGTLDEFKETSGYAWEAGTLAWDFAKIPGVHSVTLGQIVFDDNTIGLPGTAGLAEARKRLANGEPIEEIQASMLEGLGALGIRAAVQDTFGHIFLDPLQLILPRLKLPSRIATSRANALHKLGRIDDAALAAMRLESQEALKVFDKLGDIEDFETVAAHATDAVRSAEALAAAEGLALSPWEKLIVNLGGGIPLTAQAAAIYGKAFKDVKPIARLLPWNLFRITPHSRAVQVIGDLTLNIQDMIRKSSSIDEIVGTINRATQGASAFELNNLTLSGRASLTYLKGANLGVGALAEATARHSDDAAMLARVSNLTGIGLDDLVGRLAEGGGADIFASIQDLSKMPPEGMLVADLERLRDGLQFGNITEEGLNTLGSIFSKGDAAYSVNSFKAELLQRVIEHGAKTAIGAFGLESVGFFAKAADELKALETLMFLRLNPGYAVRNLWNNEITLLARGLGTMGLPDIQKFWADSVGVLPPRLWSGMGPAELSADVAKSKIGKAYQDAVQAFRFAEMGGPGAIKKTVDRIMSGSVLSKFDMGQAASKIEASASARAMTAGYLDHMKNNWLAGKGFQTIDTFNPALRGMVGDDVANALEGAIASAWSPEEVMRTLTSGNLNANLGSVIGDAAEKLGVDADRLRDSLPRDWLMALEKPMVDAIHSGDATEIRRVFTELEATITAHMDEQSVLLRETLFWQEINAPDGAGAATRVLGEVMADEMGMYSGHLRNVQDQIPAIRAIEDGAERARALKRWKQRNKASFSRSRSVQQGQIDGMLDQLRRNNVPVSEDLSRAFQRRASNFEDYYTDDAKRLDLFFERKFDNDEAKAAEWARISDVRRVEYQKLTAAEVKEWTRIDGEVARLIDGDHERALYTVARQEIRELRQSQMIDTGEDMYRANGLRVEDGEKAAFLDGPALQRRIRNQQVVADAEQWYQKLMRGDPEAQARFELRLPEDARAPLPEVADARASVTDAVENIDDVPPAFLGDEVDEAAALGESLAEGAGDITGGIQPPAQGGIKPERYTAEELASFQVDDLPPYAAEAIKARAQDLLNDVNAGPGRRFHDPITGEVSGQGPGRAGHWYLTEGYSSNKTGTQDALARIIAGTEKKVDPIADRLKLLITDTYGRRNLGVDELGRPLMPPNRVPDEPRMLDLLGRSEDQIEAALERWFQEDTQFWPDGMHEYVYGPDVVDPFPSQQVWPAGTSRAGSAASAEPRAFYDANSIRPPTDRRAQGMNELYLDQGAGIFSELENSAIKMANEKRVNLTDLEIPDQAQQQLMEYLNHASDSLGKERQVGMQVAEFRRDAALLNYSRRTRFDTMAGAIFPYQFWATHSVYNWVLHSIERPFALTTYLRIKKMFEQTRARPGWPNRMTGYGETPLQGVVGKLPFWEDWMGPLYANPLRIGLPLDEFFEPLEAARTDKEQANARTLRMLENMRDEGEITEAAFNSAVQTQSGPDWQKAFKNVSQDKDGVLDYMQMMFSPHLPITWAMQALAGEQVQPGPLLPATRTIKGLSALFGIDTFVGLPGGGFNIEATMRRFMGLPEFDQWDDYRVDRMLSNMAAEGTITADEAMRAMVDRQGDTFDEATRRAGKEYGVRAFGSIMGIPLAIYPPGEERARQLQDEFGQAAEAHRGGDDMAFQDYFDEHPESRARLALYDSPGDRLQKFMVDQVYSRYYDLPKLHQQQVRDALGDQFVNLMLNRDTRNSDNVSPEVLGMWLNQMGGDVPGILTVPDDAKIPFVNSQTAYQVQVFYDAKDQLFPDDLYDLQKEYYQMDEGKARRDFKKAHPELVEYWSWRESFLYRNPNIAPYIEEDPTRLPKYESDAALREVQEQQPNFTWGEWQVTMGIPASALVIDSVRGQDVPPILMRRLDTVGEQMGLTGQQVLELAQQSLRQLAEQ